MKTEEKTIKNAFAWDKQVLCKKLMKENNISKNDQRSIKRNSV